MPKEGKVLDDLHCSACERKLRRNSPLFDTAWLGVYWCGRRACAFNIMQENCEEFDPNDPCCRETVL